MILQLSKDGRDLRGVSEPRLEEGLSYLLEACGGVSLPCRSAGFVVARLSRRLIDLPLGLAPRADVDVGRVAVVAQALEAINGRDPLPLKQLTLVLFREAVLRHLGRQRRRQLPASLRSRGHDCRAAAAIAAAFLLGLVHNGDPLDHDDDIIRWLG
jgi:hypothetical protein